jgi:hypothetical protein
MPIKKQKFIKFYKEGLLMEDEGGTIWEKFGMLIFIIGSIIVLLVLLTFAIILPMLKG